MWKLHGPQIVAVGNPVVSHTPEEVLAVRAEVTGIFSLDPLQRNLGGFLDHARIAGRAGRTGRSPDPPARLWTPETHRLSGESGRLPYPVDGDRI